MFFDLLRKIKAEAKDYRACFRIRNVIYNNNRLFTLNNRDALIIAPHPDDDIIGCGGMIALKKALAAKVDVLFITRGELALQSRGVSNSAVSKARTSCAIRALSILGVEETRIHWLDCRSHDIEKHLELTVQGIRSLMKARPKSDIFIPHPKDGHPDHENTAEAALIASDESLGHNYYYYYIWHWINGTYFDMVRLRRNLVSLDIRLVTSLKHASLDAHLKTMSPVGVPWAGKLPQFLYTYAYGPMEVFSRMENIKGLDAS